MDETKPRIPCLVTGIFFSIGLEIKVSCSISRDITKALSVDWDERYKLNILGESSEGGKELKTWELESKSKAANTKRIYQRHGKVFNVLSHGKGL